MYSFYRRSVTQIKRVRSEEQLMASSNHEYTGYSKPMPTQTVPGIRPDLRENGDND